MGSLRGRVRRAEGRIDTSGALADPDEEASEARRDKVRAELAQFEARMRTMGKQGKEDWRNSPEGQAIIRELEGAIRRKRLRGL